MPGSIVPLPVMLEEEDQKTYENLESPKSIVVSYGYQKLIAELPYDGQAKPGCGTKLVIRTHRGIELGKMLTTTCANAGCGSSVTRKQMLQYIEQSGGKAYPFTNQGKVLRVATIEDLNDQSRLDSKKTPMMKLANSLLKEMNLPMKLVDIELLLGGERNLFHYTSDEWVDFRELVRKLASEYQTRIEMHQVNAREEARLVADYERCGQHCCCKQFLKVLKPVSMRSAKIQKATLDPTKISGRCGRLMCCLRYEDETYDSLRKKLPNRQSRVMTDDGPGTVLDTQILTQLVLVQTDRLQKQSAYPVENIRTLSRDEDEQLSSKSKEAQATERYRRTAADPKAPRTQTSDQPTQAPKSPSNNGSAQPEGESEKRPGRRRRRRRSGNRGKGEDRGGQANDSASKSESD